MFQFVREMARAVANLSLPIKFLIGVAILVEFIVITQWEHISPPKSPVPPPQVAAVAPPKIEPHQLVQPTQPSAPVAATPTKDAIAISRQMERAIIAEPNVLPDGVISGGGRTFRLYGIKQLDSKRVCTKASGDRWACGLHAYATLRNTIAKKTIICDPKTILGTMVLARCRLGSVDLALTLVQNGLIETDEPTDIDLSKAQAVAKIAKIGIWDR